MIRCQFKSIDDNSTPRLKCEVCGYVTIPTKEIPSRYFRHCDSDPNKRKGPSGAYGTGRKFSDRPEKILEKPIDLPKDVLQWLEELEQ